MLYLNNPGGVDSEDRRAFLDAGEINQAAFANAGDPEIEAQYEMACMQRWASELTDLSDEPRLSGQYGPDEKARHLAYNCVLGRRMAEWCSFSAAFSPRADCMVTCPLDPSPMSGYRPAHRPGA